MGRVLVLTESSSNLPPELVQQFNIKILPLRLNWRGESLRDGVDITPEEFYRRLEQGGNSLPTTSSLTAGELLEAIRELAMEADAMVAVLLANNLSSSIEAAEAVQLMEPQLPFYIVDSKTAGMAEGFVALEAARAAAMGAPVDEVIRVARNIAGRVHFYGALESLEYVHRGGRIGAAAYYLGTSLRMRPVVAIKPNSSQVVGIARPRTWEKAVEKMLEVMAEEVADRPVHAAVSHGNREAKALDLAERVLGQFNVCEFYITYVTPVMGAHAGPVLAVSFYADDGLFSQTRRVQSLAALAAVETESE